MRLGRKLQHTLMRSPLSLLLRNYTFKAKNWGAHASISTEQHLASSNDASPIDVYLLGVLLQDGKDLCHVSSLIA